MIRQAQNYFAGAVSGTALIAAAVVAFVALVSLQAARDWPFSGVVGGDQSGSASAPSQAAAPSALTGPIGPGGAASATAAGGPGAEAGGGGGNGADNAGGGADGLSATPTVPSAGGGPAGTQPAAGGGGSQPGGSATPSGSGGGGGGNSTSSGGRVTETATGLVGDVVSGADKATGGAVSGSGVGGVVEGAVDAVPVPETPAGSTVGNAVGETGKVVDKAVGGLPGAGD